MSEALALAARGAGTASPNPMVGAVVVAGGRVVGRGYHPRAGEPHAEIFALRKAGSFAHGATLYTTLEPCAHTGRTAPCTDAIVAAGITRVVAAMIDPDPKVRGAGVARLRDAGVEITVGTGEPAARRLNEAYIKHRTTGLPFVIAKWAMTLDGRIATRTGDSRWISGEESRAHAHRLRAASDAVLVGIGTVLRDDPALAARLPVAAGGERESKAGQENAPDGVHPSGVPQPRRVILDSRLRTPPGARALAADGTPVIVATTRASAPETRRALESRGIEVLVCGGADGRVDLAALLRELAGRGVLSVLVEGGATVHGAFADAGLVDKVVAYVAPVLVGGAAPGPVAGAGVAAIADARRLAQVETHRLGPDVVVVGYPPSRARADDPVPAQPAGSAAVLG